MTATLLQSACLLARAGTAGSVQASVSVESLTSPANAYGPWIYEDVDVQLPPDALTGIHLENRHASDRFNPNTEQYVTLDRYQHVSRASTLYASASFGSGAPYSRDRFALEYDVGVGHGVVFFAGGALGNQYGLGAAQQLSLGAYYYFGDSYASFRYAPAWSRTLGSTQGYSFTLALGHPQRTVTTFRIGSAGENDVSLITPVNPTIVGEREFGAGISVKHWITPASGFHIDLDYGALDRTNGSRIYTRRGIGLGFFFGVR